MKKTLLAFGALALGALAFLFIMARIEPRYYAAIKPTGITNVQGHLQRWGHPKSIYRRSHLGTNVFIFVGLTNTLPAGLPSGPPAYVYSNSGAFLDWSSALGDDPAVHQRWSNLWPNESDQKISPSEIDALFPR